jgi:hypothetical protein
VSRAEPKREKCLKFRTHQGRTSTSRKEVEHNVGLQDEMQALKATSVEELQEQADEVGYLTPREYAKLKGKQPQQVYTWIRKGVIKSEKCKCGKTIVNTMEADEALLRRDIALGRQIPVELDPKYLGGEDDVSGEALDGRPEGVQPGDEGEDRAVG